MGTSSKHPGSNDRSPLVPPHADAEPGKPLPVPEVHRFTQFRKSMGSYVKSGDVKDLNKGLRNYVQKATGGANVGPRRFGSAIAVGGQLLSVLSGLQAGETPEGTDISEPGLKLTDAIGKPLDVAVQILADLLSPTNEDGDRIRQALVSALSESLEGTDETFDPSILDEEIYTKTIINFLSEIVFLDIYIESKDAFEKADSVQLQEQREDEIRELIRAAIDKHLSLNLKDGVSKLSMREIKQIQLSALKDVFAEWDGLE